MVFIQTLSELLRDHSRPVTRDGAGGLGLLWKNMLDIGPLAENSSPPLVSQHSQADYGPGSQPMALLHACVTKQVFCKEAQRILSYLVFINEYLMQTHGPCRRHSKQRMSTKNG